jgi:hypothetical protein
MAKLIFTLMARIELLDNCKRQNIKNIKRGGL